VEPERLRRVEELYHSALRIAADQRAGFLKGACWGDATLCQEVESLLAYESSAEEFMTTPAFDVAAKLMAMDDAREDQTDPVPIGMTLQRFRILEKLGGGGMGVIYKAEDTRLFRTVALKFLPRQLARDPASLERFEREARAASALSHPNICTVYDVSDVQGQPFIAMELLEGRTLDQRIGGRPLPLEECLTIGLQITQGLHAAHQKGIIHRDIKPANIFVTTQGQAKILDFGLVKLASTVTVEGEELAEGPGQDRSKGATPLETVPLSTPDLFLSHTGVAMGTAGYMSPEQARGEKLDARTDLFSFGLVLYEMATGHRAFEGDTGAELQSAILKQTPVPARQLNPELPAKLGRIIGKALEKNRDARYQTVSDLRTDLETLKHETERRNPLSWWMLVAAFVFALMIVGAFYRFAKRLPESTQAPPDIKFRQLTINSSENPVASGAISRNGKYLAYVDRLGMHVKDVATGAIHDVNQPPDMNKDSVIWEIIDVGWFPDNARFLANAHPASEDSGAWLSQTASIWVFSRADQAPRKLREHAIAWSVSPKGALISFGTNSGRLGPRETWLMDSEGKQARKLFDTDENSALGRFYWSPDGEREVYFRIDASGATLLSRDLKGGPPVTLLTPAETRQIRGDISWLPDGRLIYQVGEPGSEPAFASVRDNCNFWTLQLDVQTGRPVEKPKQLTNWTGFCNATSANATADGERLAFLRRAVVWTVYVADVEAGGTRIGNMRHFTLDESSDLPRGWTGDSKQIVFISDRTGQFAFYRQSLDGDAPEPISTGTSSFTATLSTLVNPDGKWLFSNSGAWPGHSKDGKLMRIPLAGGSPELVTTTAWGGETRCARPPSSRCVLAERTADRKRLILTSIDVLKGRGPELARFDLDPGVDYWYFDISPDGTRLAVSGNPHGPIHILPLRGNGEQVIPAKFNNTMGDFFWTADGKALYVCDQTKRGTELSYLDLHGNTHVLWVNPSGWDIAARPSPDGRHLAIQSSIVPSNIWMMENF
jgi:serine/threonine protein kinase/Tol biopolymer transport system component